MSALRRLRRRIAAWPLKLCLRLSHYWLRRFPPKTTSFRPLQWQPGLSVIIPERGGGELLVDCLQGLHAALAEVGEAHEVIVVVNGSPRQHYQPLTRRYPQIRWLHFDQPLGFSRAVWHGVQQARHGGIYLLNNDMRLDHQALVEVLRWRGPAVFAVASQILFPDDGRRREETGWTFMPFADHLARPYHAQSQRDEVRGTVWAGAGSALYHGPTLARLLPDCLSYDPFYWEDVDLGIRAHRQGWESLYCPRSLALHLHRVTVQRYYQHSEVDRIFERNRLQLSLRAPQSPSDFDTLYRLLCGLHPRSVTELATLANCRILWRTRGAACAAPIQTPQLDIIPLRRHQRPTRSPILMVSPFAMLPPRHGGAIRSARLAAALAEEHPLILLSDEAALYPEIDDPSFAIFDALYLVDGRPPLDPAKADDRVARMQNHCHPALRLELQRLIELHRPRAVLIEHMELAPLIELPRGWRPPFWLSLQDVLLQPEDPTQAEADAAELALIDQYQQLIVCSQEDQALLGDRASVLVANGCDLAPAGNYQPSSGHQILFVGPFRASINWIGIRDFVSQVYPKLLAALPDLRLTIIGGPGAPERAAEFPAFRASGIEVLESVESIAPYLQQATVTINPQPSLRGSSLKVLESLAAGRVCVSTRAGARGHLQHGFAGLISCPDLSGFGPALHRLLTETPYRHALEKPDPRRLTDCAWPTCALPLLKMAAALDTNDTNQSRKS